MRHGKIPDRLVKFTRRDYIDLYVYLDSFLDRDSVIVPAERYQTNMKWFRHSSPTQSTKVESK